MGDPVTMAMVGAGVGAATSDDPLQGAMLGGLGGFAGGHMFGGAAGSAINPASNLAAKTGMNLANTGAGGLVNQAGLQQSLMNPALAGNPMNVLANTDPLTKLNAVSMGNGVNVAPLASPVAKAGSGVAQTGLMAGAPVTMGDKVQNMMMHGKDLGSKAFDKMKSNNFQTLQNMPGQEQKQAAPPPPRSAMGNQSPAQIQGYQGLAAMRLPKTRSFNSRGFF